MKLPASRTPGCCALGPPMRPAILVAADVGGQDLDLREFDIAVLAAIAYHQPITRDGLKDIFGKEISRDLTGRLHARGLIATGPRSPRRGAPYTFVTTEQFLVAFWVGNLARPARQGAAGRCGYGVSGRVISAWQRCLRAYPGFEDHSGRSASANRLGKRRSR